MITAVQTMPDGKVAFRFGADVFPVTKREAVRLAVSVLSAVGGVPEAECDAPDGILLTWLPGCYLHIGFRDAEELYFQIGDAIWDDQGDAA